MLDSDNDHLGAFPVGQHYTKPELAFDGGTELEDQHDEN